MKLYYYKAPKNNFGDDLNSWLWDRLIPNTFDNSGDAWMSVIGTIICDHMPGADTKIVFSSGAGYGHPPKGFGGEGWHVICVRGPLTAKALKLPRTAAVTDGAILLSTLAEFSPIPEKERQGIVFMPHHEALDHGAWEDVCHLAGIEFISPRDESHKTLDRIRNAKLVIADAMHAAIIADTLRVPWVPVVGSASVNAFKWLDWTMSMEIPYAPIILPSSNISEKVTRWSLNVFGGQHAKGNSAEEAIEDFNKKLIKKQHISSRIERKVRRESAKILRSLSAKYIISPFGENANKKSIETAAEALKKASRSKNYLSSDLIFKSRVKEMQNRLDTAQEIIINSLPE